MSKFKVTGVLALDGTNFQAGMTRAQAAIRGLGGSVAGSLKGQLAAAFSIGAVTMLTRRTMEYADMIDETSSRIGVGAEKLQEWTFAAKQAGSSTEQLAAFVERLTMAALDPNKQDLFKRMGIAPAGMTTEGLFEAVSKWSRGKQSSEVTPLLRELTGVKGVGALLNTLQTDLDAAGQQARAFGAVMDDTTRIKLARLNDQFSILSQILYSTIGPVLVKLGVAFLSLVGVLEATYQFYKHFGWRKGDEAAGAFLETLAKYVRMAEQMKITPGVSAPDTIGAPVVLPGNSVSRQQSYNQPDGNAAMRVGNFLGVGQSNITTLAQLQLRAQQETARNTLALIRQQAEVVAIMREIFL